MGVFCVVVVASSSSSRRRRRRRNPPSGDDDDDDAVTLPSIAIDRSSGRVRRSRVGRPAIGDRCIAWMILRAIYIHVYTPRARARRARTTPEQSRAGEEFTPTRDIPRVTRMPRLERDRDRQHHARDHAHRRKTLTHTYARYIRRSPLHRLPSSRRPPSRCPPRRSRPPSSSVATTASSGSSYVSRGDAFGHVMMTRLVGL